MEKIPGFKPSGFDTKCTACSKPVKKDELCFYSTEIGAKGTWHTKCGLPEWKIPNSPYDQRVQAARQWKAKQLSVNNSTTVPPVLQNVKNVQSITIKDTTMKISNNTYITLQTCLKTKNPKLSNMANEVLSVLKELIDQRKLEIVKPNLKDDLKDDLKETVKEAVREALEDGGLIENIY